MLIACSGTCLSFEFVAFGHSVFSVSWSGSGFRAAWLAVFVGVDGEFSDDFGCFFVRDDDVKIVDEHAYGCSGVFHAEFDIRSG